MPWPPPRPLRPCSPAAPVRTPSRTESGGTGPPTLATRSMSVDQWRGGGPPAMPGCAPCPRKCSGRRRGGVFRGVQWGGGGGGWGVWVVVFDFEGTQSQVQEKCLEWDQGSSRDQGPTKRWRTKGARASQECKVASVALGGGGGGCSPGARCGSREGPSATQGERVERVFCRVCHLDHWVFTIPQPSATSDERSRQREKRERERTIGFVNRFR